MNSQRKQVLGYLDHVREDSWARGWAERGQQGPAELSVWIDGEFQGLVVADQFRDDLSTQNKGNAAFWYSIPEKFRDGLEHEIDVRSVEHGESLHKSPLKFTLPGYVSAEITDSNNVIPNSHFDHWPRGVTVKIEEHLSETAQGWIFDFKKGSVPDITVAIDQIENVSLHNHQFGLKIICRQKSEGYMRLIVPVELDAGYINKYRLSIGIRRSPHAPNSDLHLSEIFLGAFDGKSVEKITTIKKSVKPRGSTRLLDMPIVPNEIANINILPNSNFALIFELRGEGQMQIFDPVMRLGRENTSSIDNYDQRQFEDKVIRDQIESLKLSAIWQPDKIAMQSFRDHCFQAGRPNVKSMINRDNLIPFTQIVIPVFNASYDVEECISSIISNTHSAFEIIIVDDGSGHFTAQTLANIQQSDPRIRYIRHDNNIGYTRNINYGVQSTVSDYVVLLNSDTIVTQGWLVKSPNRKLLSNTSML